MGTLDDIGTVERIGWVMLAMPSLSIVVSLPFTLTGFHFIAIAVTYSFWYLMILANLSIIFLAISGLQRRKVLRNITIILLANAFHICFLWVFARTLPLH